MIVVKRVSDGSIGSELGITPGTRLLTVDDRPLDDFLDWEYLTADESFVVAAELPGGDRIEYDIERAEGIPMGVELEPPSIRRCANRCDFCFVDGLPSTTRASLDIRDDDYRLSFRYGNFATLTNLKQKDIDRIVEYRLSPLYVSVHATDPVVRRRLLRNPLAPDVLEQLRFFSESGITFHTQIVIQPAVNDGEHLKRTIEDLWTLGDAVHSVSVVPVALTDFSRHDLSRQPTAAECAEILDLIGSWQVRARDARGFNWVYGSDDLYLNAMREFPEAGEYDEFGQLENGVGSVRFLLENVEAMDATPSYTGKTIGIFTGTAMAKHMPRVVASLRNRTGADFEIIVLENTLFGSSVTTAALLPGEAFLSAVKDRSHLDLAMLPGESTNDDGIFMDDLDADVLIRESPVPAVFSYDFRDVLARPPAASS